MHQGKYNASGYLLKKTSVDNKQLENKIKRVKQSMKTLYPKLHQNLIQYEGSMEVEDDFNIVKDLKKNKQFMKRKSFTKR